MVTRDVIVVGASAGGVEALKSMVEGLPPDLPAAVVVVLHLPPAAPSALPAILRRRCPLRTMTAEDGLQLRHGQLYVAPPDRHVLVVGDLLRLSRGPRENGHRPSIDVLFRSAAHSVGPRAVGVVLSGALDDGTAGLVAIKAKAGVAVVQDPADALVPSMPESALNNVAVDHVVTVADLGKLLDQIAREPLPVEARAVLGAPPSDLMSAEVEMAELTGVESDEEHPGVPSGFGCPDCHGALFEIVEGDVVRYRCRVGHAWSAESLLAEQGEVLEAALWTALRALEEKSELSRRMATSARGRGRPLVATRLDLSAEDASGAATVIRRMLESLPGRESGGLPVAAGD